MQATKDDGELVKGELLSLEDGLEGLATQHDAGDDGCKADDELEGSDEICAPFFPQGVDDEVAEALEALAGAFSGVLDDGNLQVVGVEGHQAAQAQD